MSVNLNTFTSFEDVYKKPFHADEYGGYVWSSNGVMTFSVYDCENLPFMKRVCRVLNGEIKADFPHKFEVAKDKTAILYNGELVFFVRGWGHLTGCYALNLNPKLAANIQDDFITHVVKTLNGEKQ